MRTPFCPFPLSVSSPTSVEVKDLLHGDVAVTEPTLQALLASRILRRLRGILQNGVSAFFHPVTPTTRWEHSVGTFVLVRRLGATLDEQVAALLHDVTHTNFSHVIDHLPHNDVRASAHELNKTRLLAKYEDELASLLGPHWHHYFEGHRWPLVKNNKQIAADILDYTCRDAVVFRLAPLQQIRRLLGAVRLDESTRNMYFEDKDAARAVIELSARVGECLYNSAANAAQNILFAEILDEAVHQGHYTLEDLCGGTLRDVDIYESLRSRVESSLLAPGTRYEFQDSNTPPRSAPWVCVREALALRVRIMDPPLRRDGREESLLDASTPFAQAIKELQGRLGRQKALYALPGTT